MILQAMTISIHFKRSTNRWKFLKIPREHWTRRQYSNASWKQKQLQFMYIAFLNTPIKKPKDPWLFWSIPFYVEIPIIHNRGLSVSTVTVLVSLLCNVLDVLINSPNRKAPLSMKIKCIKHAPVCLDEKNGHFIKVLDFLFDLKNNDSCQIQQWLYKNSFHKRGK